MQEKAKIAGPKTAATRLKVRNPSPTDTANLIMNMWMPDQIIAGKICCYKKNGVTKAACKESAVIIPAKVKANKVENEVDYDIGKKLCGKHHRISPFSWSEPWHHHYT